MADTRSSSPSSARESASSMWAARAGTSPGRWSSGDARSSESSRTNERRRPRKTCATEVLVGDGRRWTSPFPRRLVRRRPVRRPDRAPARARAVPGSCTAAAPRRRPARSHHAERRELDDAPRAPGGSLALYRARDPRPHTRTSVHAPTLVETLAERGTGSSSSTSPFRFPESERRAVERAAHAFGRLRPSLFGYQFVVAATPVR